MTRNVGTMDRVVRALAATLLITCAALAPLPAALRIR